MAGIPPPHILEGKPAWYHDLIFCGSAADKPYDASTHYKQTGAAHKTAGIQQHSIVTHLPTHVSATAARAVYNESVLEVSVAGGWHRDTQNGTYCQVTTADNAARRAGYVNRAAVANFRQLLSPGDFQEFQPMGRRPGVLQAGTFGRDEAGIKALLSQY